MSNKIRALQSTALLVALGLIFACCQQERKERPRLSRSLLQAKEITLSRFSKLENFRIESATEGELYANPLRRLEISFQRGEQKYRGIIHLIERPEVFNMIYFIAPADELFFQEGFTVFRQLMQRLKFTSSTEGEIFSERRDNENFLRCPELGLEIFFPSDWTWSIDRQAATLVISGPSEKPAHLTTINFSVIEKWRTEQNSS